MLIDFVSHTFYMKKTSLIWFGVAAVLVWYFARKKTALNTSKTAQQSIDQAGNLARSIVADVVNKTEFVPADVSDRQQYTEQRKECTI